MIFLFHIFGKRLSFVHLKKGIHHDRHWYVTLAYTVYYQCFIHLKMAYTNTDLITHTVLLGLTQCTTKGFVHLKITYTITDLSIHITLAYRSYYHVCCVIISSSALWNSSTLCGRLLGHVVQPVMLLKASVRCLIGSFIFF